MCIFHARKIIFSSTLFSQTKILSKCTAVILKQNNLFIYLFLYQSEVLLKWNLTHIIQFWRKKKRNNTLEMFVLQKKRCIINVQIVVYNSSILMECVLNLIYQMYQMGYIIVEPMFIKWWLYILEKRSLKLLLFSSIGA